jgi:hypothetical protein
MKIQRRFRPEFERKVEGELEIEPQLLRQISTLLKSSGKAQNLSTMLISRGTNKISSQTPFLERKKCPEEARLKDAGERW